MSMDDASSEESSQEMTVAKVKVMARLRAFDRDERISAALT